MIIFGSTYVFFNSLCFDNESLDVLLFILPIVEDEAVLRIRSFELNLFKNRIIIEILFCCCDNNIVIAIIVINVTTLFSYFSFFDNAPNIPMRGWHVGQVAFVIGWRPIEFNFFFFTWTFRSWSTYSYGRGWGCCYCRPLTSTRSHCHTWRPWWTNCGRRRHGVWSRGTARNVWWGQKGQQWVQESLSNHFIEAVTEDVGHRTRLAK